MTPRATCSSLRPALSRLPGWLTALGAALVLGEVAGGAMLLAVGPGVLAGLGPHQRVVLTVNGGCSGDAATYKTPTGNGHFEITLGREDGPMDCYTHGGFSGEPLTKTVSVPAGGTVTMTVYNQKGLYPLACSITVDGGVPNKVQVGDAGQRGTCSARIP